MAADRVFHVPHADSLFVVAVAPHEPRAVRIFGNDAAPDPQLALRLDDVAALARGSSLHAVYRWDPDRQTLTTPAPQAAPHLRRQGDRALAVAVATFLRGRL
jgi:hypothetical protein